MFCRRRFDHRSSGGRSLLHADEKLSGSSLRVMYRHYGMIVAFAATATSAASAASRRRTATTRCRARTCTTAAICLSGRRLLLWLLLLLVEDEYCGSIRCRVLVLVLVR